jgi:hypothetical protein
VEYRYYATKFEVNLALMSSSPKGAVPRPAGKPTFEIRALGSLGWASILTSSASGDGAEFASIMKMELDHEDQPPY